MCADILYFLDDPLNITVKTEGRRMDSGAYTTFRRNGKFLCMI